MEKIININFQGRIIPIEESAYHELKQYTDSLRRHFANEESADEIINDIENRISELLNDRLQRGAVCINKADVKAVTESIGKLEDIEAAEGEEPQPAQPEANKWNGGGYTKGRFYRNAGDKVIAGICSALAARVGIDPVIMRVLFVLLLGPLFFIYLLLWAITPEQYLAATVTRRLYRNPDDKMIAGVCGGLAEYLRVDVWIPRLIFAAPLLLGIINSGVYNLLNTWHWGFGPRMFTGSLGSTLFVIYVILWIALPYANAASEKLEMRGEKVDINSIKAEAQAGGRVNVARNRSGLGRVVGILFKVFFAFVAGMVALGLFGAITGLLFAGAVITPYTDFMLSGPDQYAMVVAGVLLLVGVPFLSTVVWIVRRLMGVRTRRHYLSYIFTFLWMAGIMSLVAVAGIIVGNFKSKAMVEDTFMMQQPTSGKLYINVSDAPGAWMQLNHARWFNDWDEDTDDMPFHLVSKDSLWLNTVKVGVTQSPDSLYHIYQTRISRGNTKDKARELAGHISFPIGQKDSVITLPGGFCISNKDKFRNQQTLITVQVPLGKTIQFNDAIEDYTWFNINVNNRRGINYERNWSDNDFRGNSVYTMTPTGLRNPQDSIERARDKEEEDRDDK